MNEPHSIDAERAVLGAMIFSVGAIPGLRALLQPEDFYLPSHQQVFSAISDTFYAEGEISYVLIAECLKDRGQEGSSGGIVYIADLAQCVATAVGVERHAKVVRDYAVARRAMAEAEKLQRVLSEGGGAQDIQAGIEVLQALTADHSDEQGAEAPAVMQDGATEYEKRAALSAAGRDFAGIDTGFDGINDRLNGLCPGELTVIGADSNVGKTTLAAQIFYYAVTAGHPGLYFSQEEQRYQVADRLALMEADGVNPVQFQKGILQQSDLERVQRARAKLSPLNWRVYDRCRSIDRIEAQLRAGRHQQKVELVVVDHLHRTSGRGENRHRELAGIVKRCKDLSLDLNTHVLLLSQLARAKDRHDRRPRIDDLRESGAIEEEADNVVLIYRPGRYDHLREEAAAKGPATVGTLMEEAYALCEKARRRGPGTVKLMWRNDVALFGNSRRM